MWKTLKLRFSVNSRGFTLLELIVTISIIAIISAAGLNSFTGAQRRGRDAKRQSDLGQYRIALENYATVNSGVYPVSSVSPGSKASSPASGIFINSGGVLANYLTGFPTDPKPGLGAAYDYFYKTDATGLDWVLQACMEGSTNTYYRICAKGTAGTVSAACPTTWTAVALCP